MFERGPSVSKLTELGSLTLFEGLARRELERICSLCTMLERPAGSVLCAEGRAGQEYFVVVDGEVAVTIKGTNVATLGPGSFFGELALLDGEPRSATVTAMTPVRFLVFDRAEFEALLDCAPRVARRMLATIGARLRHADRRVRAVTTEPRVVVTDVNGCSI
jgi:CRP-like cAMP-binding protein